MSPTATPDTTGPLGPLEERLHDALSTETTGIDASPAVWDAIRSAAGTVPVPIEAGRRSAAGGHGPGRGRLALLAVAAGVAAALLVAGIVVARRDGVRDVYVGPATTVGTSPTPTGGGGTVVTGPITPPTSDLGRALWATAALRAALEDEQLATVAARYGLRPDAEQRLVDARAATDTAAGDVTDQALPRLGDGETERNARQVLESRMRNLAVIRRAVGDPGSPSPTAPNRVGGDTTTILGQYDQTVEAVAVVGRIIAKQGGGTANGTQAQLEAASRVIQAAQRAEVPGARAQWLASTSAALAARAAEDQPGPVDPDVQRMLDQRSDQERSPDAVAGWPGVDEPERAILRATLGVGMSEERRIVQRLTAGLTPGGTEGANALLDEARDRLAELHRYEQALISRL